MNNRHFYIIALLTINTSSFASDDVVERFEAITEKFSLNMVNYPAKISPPTSTYNKWVKRQAHLYNVAYDVKKTNSLISPFSGEITYRCTVTGRYGATKEIASNGADDFDTTGRFCLGTYAFQKNKWIKKSVICKYESSWREPGGAIKDCASALPESE